MNKCTEDGKEIVIKWHAVIQARNRRMLCPDDIYFTITNGKKFRFGKNLFKFIRMTKYGTIICIGEEFADKLIIRTVERGN